MDQIELISYSGVYDPQIIFVFDLSNKQLEDDDINVLSLCKNILSLNLSFNKLKFNLINISNLFKLRFLDLSNNLLTNKALESLCNMKGLEYLYLEGNLIDSWVTLNHLASVIHFPSLLHISFQTTSTNSNPICNDINYHSKIVETFCFRKNKNIKATELIAIDHKRMHYSNETSNAQEIQQKEELYQQWIENDDKLISKLDEETVVQNQQSGWHQNLLKESFKLADITLNPANCPENNKQFQALKNQANILLKTCKNEIAKLNTFKQQI